jgi:16S rRNA (guanine527-N7)-methyltransferase
MNENLKIYYSLLLKWQKTINLVSPNTLDNAWKRHFEDSIQLANYIPENAKTLCDIGSGAGFPGLVLAIMRPDITFHLVESDARKCAFLSRVSRETSCNNVTIHNDRIENVMGGLAVDCATARALAPLETLLDYVQPQFRNNIAFTLLAMKGQNYKDEILKAEENYTFDFGDYASQTDENARILSVSKIIAN